MQTPGDIFKLLLPVLTVLWVSCSPNAKSDPAVHGAAYRDTETLIGQLRTDSLSREEQADLIRRAEQGLRALDYDTVPTALYLELFDALRDADDTAAVRRSVGEALELARVRSDSLAIGNFQLELAQYYRRQNTPDRSFLYSNRAYQIFNELGDDFMAGRSLYDAAVAQFFANDYLEAEKTAIEALRLFGASDDPEKEHKELSTYNLLGTIASVLQAHERALNYREKALEYVGTNGNSDRPYSGLMNNLGTAHFELGNYDTAREYFLKVLNRKEIREQEPRLYARSLVNYARANLESGRLDSVETDYLRALDLRMSIGDTRSLPRSYYFLAEYYLREKDTNKAREYLQKGKEIAREIAEVDGLVDILKLQVRAEPEQAADYALELDELRNELMQEERSMRDKFARVKYETDLYIAENRELARERLMWILIAAGVILLGISVSIIIYQRIRNQRLRFLQQQQEANQEIFNLMLTQNAKIEEGKQEEQKRISEELHDGVLGEMNGIRMVLLGLNGKSDDKSRSMRSQAIEKLKAVQEEIRGISHALSDAAYQKFHNFILSMEELLERTAGVAGLDYEFEYDRDAEWDDLPVEVKINLYRIVQECLQNTIKHAGAAAVRLQLEADSRALRAIVSDNGKGYQSRRGKNGIGQKNIASRVSRMGGTWETRTAPGAGTEVRVLIPRTNGHIFKSQEVLEGTL